MGSGVASGWDVMSSGGRPKHFSAVILTASTRTLSSQATHVAPPQSTGLCQLLLCLPACPLHLLASSPGDSTCPVRCEWDIWENSAGEIGENSELFPK